MESLWSDELLLLPLELELELLEIELELELLLESLHCDDELLELSTGIGGRFSRSSGMSGGGTGG